MIINYLERYFYIICFATYVRQNANAGFEKTFVNWLDEHKELRAMIEEGKDKLEWTRKVDQTKVCLNFGRKFANDINSPHLG